MLRGMDDGRLAIGRFARLGERQCSRAYAMLGCTEPAMWHAGRCLALCEEHGIGDVDIAFAWEAIARAALQARDPSSLPDSNHRHPRPRTAPDRSHRRARFRWNRRVG